MQIVITNPETIDRVCRTTARALAVQLRKDPDQVLRAIQKNHTDGTLVCVRDGDLVCLVPAAQVQQ